MANYDLTYEGSRVQGILDTGNSLKDAGYIFRGEATPSTVPGTPTERVAYIGGPGTYTNFGGSITVGAGCICVFKYTGSAWSNQVINTGLSDAISSAINSEATTRSEADTSLQNAINSEATTRSEADTALQNAINSEATTRSEADTALQNAITAINNNIGNGYVFAGVATPSTSPVTGKVFYLAVQAGTYTNFEDSEETPLAVTAGINILKNTGTGWVLDQVIAIDAEPTQGSANLVKSGGVLNSIIQNGPAFDLSAYNAQGGVLATYDDLSAALTALNDLPADFKKGGMSFKFVRSSDNKYVKRRLMANTFTTDVTQWQGVDNEPTDGSENLVKSGGVKSAIIQNVVPYAREIQIAEDGKYIAEDGTVSGANSYFISEPISLKRGNLLSFYYRGTNVSYLSKLEDGVYTPILFGTSTGSIIKYYAEDDTDVYICGIKAMLTDTDTSKYYNVYAEAANYKDFASLKEYIDSIEKIYPVRDSEKPITSGAVYNATSHLNRVATLFTVRTVTTDILCKAGHTYSIFVYGNLEIPFDIYLDNHYSDNKVTINKGYQLYTLVANSDDIIKLYNSINQARTKELIIYIADEISVSGMMTLVINDLFKNRNTISHLLVSEWNIGYWNNGVKHQEGNQYGVPDADVDVYLPQVKELLTKICSDILVITEWVNYFNQGYTLSSYDTLLKQFYPYKYTDRGNNKPAIFSKYPFVGSTGSYLTDEDTYTKGVFNIQGKEVVVVAAHLPSAESDAARRMQIFTDVINEYQDSQYVIFTGDTNIYNKSELQPFVTAGWVIGNCGYFGDIQTWIPQPERGWYIDNVVTKGFNIDNFKRVDEEPVGAGVSDHYPVISNLSVLL